MINRVCSLCGEYVQDVWVLIIRDEKEKMEFSGHNSCVDNLDDKVKSIKDVHKLPLKKVLLQLNLNKRGVNNE